METVSKIWFLPARSFEVKYNRIRYLGRDVDEPSSRISWRYMVIRRIIIPFVPPLTMKHTNRLLDIGILTAFHNVLVHVCILTAVVLVNNGNIGWLILPPRDVLEDVIVDFIEQYDTGYICQKPRTAQASSNRKRKMVDYDRERASKIVRRDWFCPSPRFDDRQFECMFRLKRSMVEKMSLSLANFDPCWLSSVDCHLLIVVGERQLIRSLNF